MINSEAGFPSALFLVAVQDDFKCCICRDVLNDPLQCKNGHLACKFCFETTIQIFSKCPICNVPASLQSLSKCLFARNQISDLMVSCFEKIPGLPLPTDYCSWTGKLSARASHIKACGFCVLQRCPFFDGGCSGCFEDYTQTNLLAHLTELNSVLKATSLIQTRAIEVYKDNLLTVEGVIPRDIFCGEKRLGKRKGLGICTTRYGDQYFGSWLDDKKHGLGVSISYNWTYIGDYKEGRPHGVCHLNIDREGAKYSGMFENGQIHGHGKKTKPNSLWSYEGEWQKGQRHGHGKFTSALGDETFEGEFVNNSIRGQGQMTFANKDTIVGTFLRGKCHGQGVWKNSDGVVLYKGSFEDGMPNGHGISYMSEGRVYEGMFKKGNMCGEGRLTHPNGDVHRGNFRKNEMMGWGIKENVQNEQLEGYFINGVFDGV
jgi:hypothetical protein